ncbi:DUF4347 domain-containing protein, partial [Flavobacterium sp. ABG]|uniref:DUF4347 domain-containing protein n=1 Tax=Flavobacterium sp. ABG TaxID=1423322 RepID=UPI000649EF18
MRRKVLNSLFFLCSFVSLFFNYSEISAKNVKFNTGILPGFESSFRNEDEKSYIDKSVQDLSLYDISKNNTASTVYNLVTHGKSGALYIENKWRSKEEIALWMLQNIDFSKINHINIYGCEFAKGREGKAAVRFLEHALGITVAASNNITGKNGDWNLEVGKPVQALSFKEYKHNLQYAPGNDFDGDGVINSVDLDDDNDGILDALEAPSCYYNVFEALVMAKVSTGLTSSTVNSIAVTPAADIPTLRDGVSTTLAASDHVIAAGQTSATTSVIYTIEYPVPVNLATVNVIGATASWGTGSFAVLEGSTNGTTYTMISAPLATSAGTTKTWTVQAANQNDFYRYYRIRVSTVGSTTPTFTNFEVTATQGPAFYSASANPKPTCSVDTDGDGVTNNFDLDSDGDGCPDARESRVTGVLLSGTFINIGGTVTAANAVAQGPYGTNGLASSLENNDTSSAVLNFYAAYNPYAVSNVYKGCLDSDTDGVPDLADLDDDNDGVLDAIEAPGCYLSASEALVIAKIGTGMFSSTVNSVTVTPGDDIPTLRDGTSTSVAASDHVIAAGQANSTSSVIYTIEYPVPVNLATVNVIGATASWGTGSFAVLEGSVNGMVYTTISAPVATSAGTTKTWTVQAANQNDFYRYYRIRVSTVGTTTPTFTNFEVTATQGVANYAASANPKTTCSVDTDGDGKINTLDLDSDGDGCPDAKESGVSGTLLSGSLVNTSGTVTAPNAVAQGPYGANGLANGIENNDTFLATTNYTPLYDSYATASGLNLCGVDTDGDGVGDLTDLDDDNDGVPDATESPACYYLAGEWNSLAKPAVGVSVTSSLTTTTGNFSQLTDGIGNATAVTFSATPTQAIQNANVYLFTFGRAMKLEALYLQFNTATQFAGTTKIQGSNTNNGADWVDLSAAIAQTAGTNVTTNGLVSLTNSIAYPVTLNKTIGYKYIRITGVAASNIAAQNASEVYFDFNIASYIASNYPKSTCVDANVDGDGILPQLDLDSDGDGCSDAFESGATTNLTANFKFTGADSNGDGLVNAVDSDGDGIVNYTSTYKPYAQSKTIRACEDTDGDGIYDIADLDDDNDGVTDINEQTKASCGTVNCTSWVSPPTTATTTAPATVVVDGEEVSYTITTNTTITAQGSTGYTFQCGLGPLNGVPYWQRVDANNQTVTFNFSKPVTNFQIVAAAIESAPPGLIESFQVTTNNGTGQQTMCESCNKSNLTTIDNQNVGVMANGTSTEIFIVDGPVYTSVTVKVTSVGGAYLMAYGLCALKTYDDSNYLDLDTDGDTISNRLDLDSDGDSCGDLVEAGVSPTTDVSTPSATNNVGGSYGISTPAGSQLNPAATDVNNDGLNDSVDTDLDGATSYTNTYYPLALDSKLNSCSDKDNDTVKDITDIDDDNDAILDAVESPSCFYTFQELKNVSFATSDLSFDSVTQPFSFALDGDPTTWGDITTGITSNRNLIEFNLPLVTSLPLATVTVQIGINNAFPSSSFQLQGYNGTSWEALSAAQAMTTPNITYTYTNTLQPTKAYNRFRIQGLAGTGSVTNGTRLHEVNFTFAQPYIISVQPKAVCSADSDGDTVPNYLDLDSDGDGCPDAKESGVTGTLLSGNVINTSGTVSTPNAVAQGPYGTNGLANPLENNDTSAAATSFTSTYSPYALSTALNGCADSDGDGVADLVDIDDDNDGIVDAVEAPSCYYTASEASVVAKVSTGLTTTTVNSVVVNSGDDIPTLRDGTSTTVAASNHVVPAGLVYTTSSVLYNIEYPVPVNIATLNVIGATASWGTGYLAVLEGSTNGSTYTTISAPVATSVGTTKTWTVQAANQNDFYRYYRIRVSTVGTTTPTFTNYEITSTQGPAVYASSANPKATCSVDTDGDGITNNLDLDSDGDGCPDAKESGVTGTLLSGNLVNTSGTVSAPNAVAQGPYGTNGLANPLENNDTSAAITSYNTTYNPYALSTTFNACTDSDSDGISNLVDIDDDNDGILDAVEAPSCYYTALEALTLSKITTGLATTTVNSVVVTTGTDIPTMRDGTSTTVAASNHVIPAGLTTATNSIIYALEYPVPVNVANINVIGATASWGTGSFAVLEGSTDGSTYTVISAPLDTSTGTTKTWSVLAANQNNFYKYYRIRVSTVGSTTPTFTNFEVTATQGPVAYAVSANPKPTCSVDTDNDGVTNNLDLDSDGDGCPDAKESGVTGTLLSGNLVNTSGTVSAPNAVAQGPYGVNGLANPLENNDTAGAVTSYTSTYNLYATYKALNACADSDNDGVSDLADIDDDNDGILDAVEAPTCYYTAAEALVLSKVSTGLATTTVNSLVVNPGDDIATMRDGTATTVTASNHVVPAALVYTTSSVIYNIEYPVPVNLATVNVIGATASWGTGFFAVLEGSTNGTTYTTISAPVATSTGTTKTWTVQAANQNDFYKYYRIRVSTVGTTTPTYTNYEVTSTQGPAVYGPSSNPKPTCSVDTDGDGITNNLDLDSDGDGCPDAKESGVTGTLLSGSLVNTSGTVSVANAVAQGPYGTNGLANPLENNDTGSAITSYNSTYSNYAVFSTLNACTDSDGDGIGDIADIDDDNDGILDTVEAPSCYLTATEALVITKVATGLTTTTVNSVVVSSGSDIPTLRDGTTTTVAASDHVIPAGLVYTTSSVIYNVEYQVPVNLATLNVIGATASWGTGYFAVLEGSTNGVTYNTISAPVATSAGTTKTWTVQAANQNDFYRYYRIRVSTVGTTTPTFTNFEITATQGTAVYGASANPKPVCSVDTDGDGVTNNLDLDSDGDGCPDAKEATVTGTLLSGSLVNTSGTVTAANAVAQGPYGANGLANPLENNDTAAAVTSYTSTYNQYSLSATLNACLDTDGDGVGDLVDIDDDNDGILDTVEQGSCVSLLNGVVDGSFEAAAGVAWNENTNTASLNSTLGPTGWASSGSCDTWTGSFSLNGSGFWGGALNGTQATPDGNIFAAIYNGFTNEAMSTTIPASKGIQIGQSYTFDFYQIFGGTNGVTTVGQQAQLRFTVDGVAYLSDMMTYNGNNIKQWAKSSITFVATTTAPALVIDVLAAGPGDGNYIGIDGITLYKANTPGCGNIETDLDGDGIVNRLDLDSDGDGCPDAKESGVTGTLLSGNVVNTSGTVSTANAVAQGPYGANGLANPLENNDTVAATTSYPSTYSLYALNAGLNACKDSDGDGILDLVDIDDDNDGILDAIEAPSCFYTSSEVSVIAKVSTGLASSTVNSSAVTAGNDIPTMRDGISTTVAASDHVIAAAQTTTTSTVIYTIEYPGLINLATVNVIGATASWGTGSFAVLEGSVNGITYTTISAPLATSTGTTKTWTVQAANQNDFYKFFRIRVSTVGSTTPTFTNYEITATQGPAVYAASINPKPTCSVDSDADGITNNLDLDSDGDGCPDAKESGVSGTLLNGNLVNTSGTVNAANAIAQGPYGNNGLANPLENNDTSFATTSYTSTYNAYAIYKTLNACADTDGDGVADLVDIDDDNDGILDTVEATSCYYTAAEATKITNVTSNLTIGSATPITNTYDGIDSTASDFYFNPGQNAVGLSIYEITPTVPVAITAIRFSMYNLGFTDGGAGNTVKLQGYDGASWIDLNAAAVRSTINATETFTNTLQPGVKYAKYRITGATGTAYYARVLEIYVDAAASYNASQNPKPTCSVDTDGDGITNNLDLDSDGDGCPDAKEATVTGTLLSGSLVNTSGTVSAPNAVAQGPYGANGLANPLENNDTAAATTSYTSTYNAYAIYKTLNACADTDGDGVADLVDIDDDNDGILDTVEATSCYYTAAEATKITNVTSNLTIGSGTPITNTYDGIDSTASDFYFNPGQNAVGLSIYEITPTVPVAIAAIRFSMYNLGFTDGGAGNTVKLQGYDGASWIDLNAAAVRSTVNATETFTNTLQPGVKYAKYRITGAAGTAYYARVLEIYVDAAASYNASQNPKPTCSVDTDGDGITNNLDLDSDGDGCPDAKEATVTGTLLSGSLVNTSGTVTAPNAIAQGPYGTNGLANPLENNDTAAGTTSYTSTYAPNAVSAILNGCLDSDGDGVGDLVDIDDDNDGILDTVESAICKVADNCGGLHGNDSWIVWDSGIGTATWSGHMTYGSKTVTVTLKSNNATAMSSTTQATWDNASTGLNSFCPANFTGSVVTPVISNAGSWTLTFSEPIPTPRFHIWSYGGGGGQAPLVFTGTYSLTKIQQGTGLNFTANNTLHQLDGVTTYAQGTTELGDTLSSITFSTTQAEFWWSVNVSADLTAVAAECGDIDTDGDGIVNRLDLDSDGDGCPDAKEATVTGTLLSGSLVNTSGTVTAPNAIAQGPYGTNGLANPLENNDTAAATTSYTSTYSQYAVNSTLNACIDSDGDGVGDLVDIDDDNDGILDTTECLQSSVSAVPSTVLINTTNEDTFGIRTGLITEFTNYMPAGSTVSNFLTLEGATVPANYYSGYDMVVIESTSNTINAAHWAALTDAIVNKKSKSFAFFVDGCCNAANMTSLVSMLNTVYGSSYSVGPVINAQDLALNANADYYSLMNPIWPVPHGAVFQLINGVADKDVLNYGQGFPNSAFIIMRQIPGASSKGNFVFVSDDATPTQSGYYPQNQGRIATALNTVLHSDSSCNLDTDGDGIPNRLDLDSDGDGCPDAKESGVTGTLLSGSLVNTSGTVSAPNAVAQGPYGANGLANPLENNDTQSATTSYASTYPNYALSTGVNACIDTDNDGVPDLVDIDDDNDSILDVIEAPSCYYTAAEASVIANVSTGLVSTTVNSGPILPGNDIPTMRDGVSTNVVASNHVVPAGLVYTTSTVIYNIQYPVPVNLATLNVVGATASWGTGFFAVLEGSTNGTTYTTISAPVATSAGTTKTWTVQAANQNDFYKYYRIRVSTVGTTTPTFTNYEVTSTQGPAVYVAASNPKATCSVDTDGDGVTNNLDLDSDGDGCPDAKESGATGTLLSGNLVNTSGTVSAPNAIAQGPYGANGLANPLENNDTAAATTSYLSTYNNYAIYKTLNACSDSDNDGISDLVDIDDDNDGILDAVEAPSCYYTAAEALVLSKVSTGLTTTTVNSVVVNSGDDIPTMRDGTSTNVAASNHVVPAGLVYTTSSVIYNIEYPVPVNLATLNVVGATASWGTGYSAVLEGSTNASTYTTISAPLAISAGATKTWTVQAANQNDFYKYYRIRISTVGTTTPTYTNYEITATQGIAVYGASANPKPTCSVDTDGDGITNNLDLDSDGDGCPDAKESSVTGTLLSGSLVNTSGTVTAPNAVAQGPYGANGLANGLENNDTTKAVTSYTSTYTKYATASGLNLCTDTDGDGIGDLVDIDDDNDGILDTAETVIGACAQFGTRYYATVPGFDNSLGSTALASYFSGTDIYGQPTFPSQYTTNANNPNGGNAGTYNVVVTTSGITQALYDDSVGTAANGDLEMIVDEFYLDLRTQNNVQFNVTSGGAVDYTWLSVFPNGDPSEVPLTTQITTSTGAASTFTPAFTNATGRVLVRVYHFDNGAGDNYVAQWQSAQTTVRTISSANVSSGCILDIDTDGDGIANRLDLDSDGDGCPDAKESGVTGTLLSGNLVNTSGTVSAPNAVAQGPYGNNGLANPLENNDTAAATTSYPSTYTLYGLNKALNVCADTDGDGINDLVDIDDDNDGILDAVEAPSCYYTAAEGLVIAKVSTGLASTTVNSITVTPGNDILTLHDGTSTNVAASNHIVAAAQTSTTSSIIYTIEYPAFVNLATVNVIGGTASWGTGSFAVLEGSINGVAYTTISAPVATSAGTTKTWAVQAANQNDFYKYYRIRVSTVGSTTPTFTNYEITATQGPATYIASSNPKATCSVDTDGDGKTNNVDLDSDGDGCSDHFESGVSMNRTSNFTYGSSQPDTNLNGFNDTLESLASPGIYTGTYTYVNATIISPDSDGDGVADSCDCFDNTRTDTDGDGVPDYADVDDDNDGISDIVEGTVDTDGDGIINSLDLDSDNDGIPDAIEASGNLASYTSLVSCRFPDGNVIDAGGCETGQSTGGLITPINTDGDALPDYLDLNSDNDSCSDAQEAGINIVTFTVSVNAYSAVNDGSGTGLTNAGCFKPINTDWINSAIAKACCEIIETSLTIAANSPTNCTPGNDGSLVISNGGLLPGKIYQVSYVKNGAAPVVANMTSNSSSQLTIPNLMPGSYTDVIVSLITDSGCFGEVPGEPFIIQTYQSNLAVTNLATNIGCQGQSTGAINATVNGGTGPFTYSWNTGQTTEDLTGIPAGSYTLTVTDAKGCKFVTSPIVITQPSSTLTANLTKQNATTGQGCSNGSVTVTATGGTAPYTYLWSNGGTTATITGLTNGAYSVTVTDTNGCTFTESVVVDCVNTCDAVVTVGTVTNVLCTGT